ncbi:MAG: ribosome-associated protein [Candidatus Petromonas sp.]|jgi:ribosome-associated protein|nr:ribosome-associated protein [Candidatus Petromonas sp.]
MTDSPKDLALKISKVIDDKKGKDIKILDMTGFPTLAEYFVIATGSSSRHTTAIADEIIKKITSKNVSIRHKEGYNKGKWILLDYLNVVVHLFTEEEREFYDLERIWKGAKYVELDIDTLQ